MNTISPYNQKSFAGTDSYPKTKPAMTSIFYINDVHGQTGKMESLATAAQSFDTFVKQNPK